MAKYGSPAFGAFLVDGYNLLAAKVQGVTWKVASTMQRADGLGDAFEASSPTGGQKAELTQSGAFFDDAAAGMHVAFSGMPVTSRVICLAPYTNVIGKPFAGFQGGYSSVYEVLGKDNNLSNANATYTISGALERGQILAAWSQQSGTFTTTAADVTTDLQRVIPITSNSIANPTVITTPVPHGLTTGQKVLISGVATSSPTINGDFVVTVIDATHFSVAVNVTVAGTGGSFVASSTVNGGAAYLEVSQFAGLTNLAVKVQHSADNSTFADLTGGGFTNVTASPAAQRIVIAAGTTINRYTRVVGTFTGTGTVTPFVGLSRA